jgi:hypothetical protein
VPFIIASSINEDNELLFNNVQNNTTKTDEEKKETSIFLPMSSAQLKYVSEYRGLETDSTMRGFEKCEIFSPEYDNQASVGSIISIGKCKSYYVHCKIYS